jgi:hypothetical protein
MFSVPVIEELDQLRFREVHIAQVRDFLDAIEAAFTPAYLLVYMAVPTPVPMGAHAKSAECFCLTLRSKLFVKSAAPPPGYGPPNATTARSCRYSPKTSARPYTRRRPQPAASRSS